MMNEAELVSGLMRRERVAIEFLYDHYSPAIYGLIVRMTEEGAEADKLFAAAVEKVVTGIAKYEPSRHEFQYWMLSQCRSLCLEWRRRINGGRDRGFGQNSGSANEGNEYADVLAAICLDGLTPAEAAQCLNIPLGTVRTRLHAAVMQKAGNP